MAEEKAPAAEPKKESEAPQEPDSETKTKSEPKKIGGFEIIRRIGSGAMGAVFLARQVSLDREVALKILPRKIAKDEKFITRFQREARASAILNHPNIVQGIDVGQDPDSKLWYFAMEFIDGPTLREVLEKEKVLSEEKVLQYGLEMARALECAERHKVVHRDIKPANIILNSRGETKLADLGLAHKTTTDQSASTNTGKAIGTPFYMAPEQVRGLSEKVDTRTDIYALGATLWHLATGRVPFKGATGAETMSLHLTQKVELPHRVNPKFSEATSRLIIRMMEKEQDKRVPSASALVEEFTNLQRKEGSTTGPRRPIRSGSTTGPRSPIERKTTGPRVPIKGTGTTGPRIPVGRGTTGPRRPVIGGSTRLQSPVKSKGENDAARPSRGKNKILPILGCIAGAAALAVVVLAMGQSRQPQDAQKKPGVRNPRKKVSRPTPRKVPDKRLTAAQAKAEQARKDYDQLVKFTGLAPDNHARRLELVESFLAKHKGTDAAAKAGPLAERLRESLAEQAKAEKEKASAEAFTRLTNFEGIAPDDLDGRTQMVEAFLKAHPDAAVTAKARALLTELAARKKATPSPTDTPPGPTDVAQANPTETLPGPADTKGKDAAGNPSPPAEDPAKAPVKEPAPPDPPKVEPKKPVPVEPAKPEKPAFAPDPKAPASFNAAAEQEYAGKTDPRAMALQWMKVAKELKASPYTQKAAARAHEAAKRHEATYGGADKSPEESQAVKLIQEADKLAAGGDTEGAIKAYKNSLRHGETIVAHRKLGLALFSAADKRKKEWETEFEKVKKEYQDALRRATRTVRGRRGTRTFVNHSYQPLVQAKRTMAGLYNEANRLFGRYNEARKHFKSVMDLMPGGLDLEAEAHTGFSYTVKADALSRSKGRKILTTVLAKYKPTGAKEEGIYNRCKSELQRIKK